MIGATIVKDGVLYVDVDLGMPLTGRVNLAETPLLMLIGDIRWKHLEHLSGVVSKMLKDENGQRVYATFFYVEVWFPPNTPMGSFEENDQFTIVSTMRLYDEGTADGYHVLYPAAWPEHKKAPVMDYREAVSLGVPFVRTSNAFVKMVKGASWLKRANPMQLAPSLVPTATGMPDSYTLTVKASRESRFRRPDASFTPLTAGKIKLEYQPDPDRDLNGVGLLYFANYPMALDVVERRALSGSTIVPLSHDLLDLRTVVHRQSAYLCNIVPSDSIDVLFEAWIANPFLSNDARPEASPVRVLLNFEMSRRSDNRQMMVSTVEKVIHGMTVGEAGLTDALKQLAAAPQRQDVPAGEAR